MGRQKIYKKITGVESKGKSIQKIKFFISGSFRALNLEVSKNANRRVNREIIYCLLKKDFIQTLRIKIDKIWL